MKLFDGLKNILANLGTGRDKAASTFYAVEILAPHQLLDTYRTSWLARAIVDYPAEDATRKWRSWRADAKQIELIEAEERRLHLRTRVEQAMTAARLYKGAAIYINTGERAQEMPLIPGTPIKSLVVLTSNNLMPGEIVRDIDSEYYNRPEFYTLTVADTSRQQVVIHASRLAIFVGAQLPADAQTMTASQGWGDSVLQSTMDAIRNTDSTMANIASLVFEAKVDVFKFEGYADMLQNSANDEAVLRRLNLQSAMKGINGAVVVDAKDDYQQKSASFGGLPEVVNKFQETVAGASGIPVTRLFGRSAAGLSGSGDGDERVYYDRINHQQSTRIGPAIAHLDDCLIFQALGSRPPEIHCEWTPLRQLTELERADIFVKTSTAARSLAGTNAGELVPLDALSDALVNELTEQGCLPGLDAAVKQYGSLSEQDLLQGAEDQQNTPSSIADSAPRPLYVSRKVLNAKAILAHFAAQGLENLIAPEDMHVTITYSKIPVNWMAMGDSWDSELVVQAGGPRVMEVFGEKKDTAVMSFSSSDLKWRHDEMIEKGASWDLPEYQPHLSISYDFAGDIGTIQPWTGEIKFGPEIFETINENWKDE